MKPNAGLGHPSSLPGVLGETAQPQPGHNALTPCFLSCPGEPAEQTGEKDSPAVLAASPCFFSTGPCPAPHTPTEPNRYEKGRESTLKGPPDTIKPKIYKQTFHSQRSFSKAPNPTTPFSISKTYSVFSPSKVPPSSSAPAPFSHSPLKLGKGRRGGRKEKVNLLCVAFTINRMTFFPACQYFWKAPVSGVRCSPDLVHSQRKGCPSVMSIHRGRERGSPRAPALILHYPPWRAASWHLTWLRLWWANPEIQFLSIIMNDL